MVYKDRTNNTVETCNSDSPAASTCTVHPLRKRVHWNKWLAGQSDNWSICQLYQMRRLCLWEPLNRMAYWITGDGRLFFWILTKLRLGENQRTGSCSKCSCTKTWTSTGWLQTLTLEKRFPHFGGVYFVTRDGFQLLLVWPFTLLATSLHCRPAFSMKV